MLAVGYPFGKLYKRSIIEENYIRFDERIRNHEPEELPYIFLYISNKSQQKRLKVLNEQAEFFRKWQKIYKYRPASWKHKLIYALVASSFFTSAIKDFLLCEIYHVK